MLGDGIFYEQTTPGSLSNVTTYVICSILLATSIYVVVQRSAKLTSPCLAALVSGIAVSLVGFATNWDLKFNDLPPIFFSAGAFLALSSTSGTRAGKLVGQTLTASSILGLVMALVLCCTRARMVSGGPWAETPPENTAFHRDRFFGYFGGSANFGSYSLRLIKFALPTPKPPFISVPDWSFFTLANIWCLPPAFPSGGIPAVLTH